MNFKPLSLPGLLLVQPTVHYDHRGFFLEAFQAQTYATSQINCKFVQDNHSRSYLDVVRGLHFQRHPGQAKLVRVVSGEIFDVAVDLRRQSPTFGRWQGVILDDIKHEQLFIPLGFAHGFCVLSPTADVIYKVDQFYSPATEVTLAYNDPYLDIAWPTTTPIVSAKDQLGKSWQHIASDLQP